MLYSFRLRSGYEVCFLVNLTCVHNMQGFPCGSVGRESACNEGDLSSISGLGRFPGEGKGYPLQYSVLENSMDSIVHGGHKELGTTERLSLYKVFYLIVSMFLIFLF